MQCINENTQKPGGGRVDVPLSVWSIWDDENLVERLAAQFAVEFEQVALVDLPGADRVLAGRRTPVAFCDATAAEAEHAKLQALGEIAPMGWIEPAEKRTLPTLLRAWEGRAALTICTDDPDRNTITWAAVAATVRPFGLLAVIWDDDRPTLKARVACDAAELSYAGHIVTARVSSFDRAVISAESLEQNGPGVHGRVVRHVGLWAKYPRSGL